MCNSVAFKAFTVSTAIAPSGSEPHTLSLAPSTWQPPACFLSPVFVLPKHRVEPYGMQHSTVTPVLKEKVGA